MDKVARDGFWIAPSGRVWWSRKIFLTLSCRMSFADMPYDTQRCPITLTGYQHGATEIELKIPYDVKATGLTHASVVTAPTFINGPIRAACQKAGSLEWQMTNINGSNSSSSSGDSASSSTFINYDIHLTRSPGFVMQNAVFPTILVVCVAWTSFFIERGAVPARVAVVLIAYLTVSGITSAVTATLPRSPEPAWIINVLWMSRIFVFLAIFEYAIANYLKRAEARITKAMPAAKETLKREENITYASAPAPIALDDVVLTALKKFDVDPEKLRPYAEDGPFLDHPFLDKVLQDAGVAKLGTRLKAIEALVHPPAKHGALQKSARKSAETDQVEVQVEDVSHYQETSTTPPGTAQQLIQQVRKSKLVTRADRKLIMATTKGRRSIVGHGEVKMCIRDQDVDIFCEPHEKLSNLSPFLAYLCRAGTRPARNPATDSSPHTCRTHPPTVALCVAFAGRYAFPLVYFVTFMALFLALPTQPTVAPFISDACL